VPEPASLAVSVSDNVRELAFTGVADLRDDDTESFIVDFTARGLPVDLGSALKDMGVGGFTGMAAIKLHGTGSTSGSVSAKSEMRIADGRLIEPSGTIAQAVAQAMRSVESINVGVDYVQEGRGSPRFAVTTNLNDLVTAALAATADRYALKAETELEAAFKNYAGTELEGKLGSKEGAATLLAAAKGDKIAADSLGASLDAKCLNSSNGPAPLPRTLPPICSSRWKSPSSSSNNSRLVLEEPLGIKLLEGAIGLHRRDSRVERCDKVGSRLEDEAEFLGAQGAANCLELAGIGPMKPLLEAASISTVSTSPARRACTVAPKVSNNLMRLFCSSPSRTL